MANGKPHIHTATMERKYASINSGPYVITYGDQKEAVRPWWCLFGPCLGDHTPTKRRVNRAIKRAIRKHDKGSRKYDAEAALRENATRRLADLNASLRANEWASERVL